MEKKLKNFWFSLFPMLVVFGIQFLLSIMLAEFGYIYTVATYDGGGFDGLLERYFAFCTDTGALMVVEVFYAAIAIAIFVPWYRKVFPEMRVKQPVRQMLHKPVPAIAGALLFVVGMQYLSVYLTNILAIMQPKWLAEYETVTGSLEVSGAAVVVMVLYVVALGPICEELAFRGLTMGHAGRAVPFWAANVIQALLFAALHMNPIQSIYTFMLGLFFGYLCHVSGNLVLTVALHMIFNVCGLFLNQYLVVAADSPVTFFIGLMIGMAATYVGFELLLKSMPKRVNIGNRSSDMDSTA